MTSQRLFSPSFSFGTEIIVNQPKKRKEMFTLDQIKVVQTKVKSGKDFPAYVQDLIRLGVTGYETYVGDGRTIFHGKTGYTEKTGPKHQLLKVEVRSTSARFVEALRIHQEGKTNYETFCRDCAEAGIEKWVVDTCELTCTYYDQSGNVILVESIPGVQ